MEFGICLLSIVPMRREASDKSEMVNQLLFGDLVLIEERKDDWLFIRKAFDNYEGWMDIKQIEVLGEQEFYSLNKTKANYISDLANVIEDKTSKFFIPVVLGSTIRDITNDNFKISGKDFQYSGILVSGNQPPTFNTIYETALLFLNAPYLWGGISPFGIDCSGFIQTVYKLVGINLLRDASQQATQGEQISLIEEAKPGDLLFFDNQEGNIVHVGIMLNDKKIIHASGKVRIDSVDHQGIYNRDLKKYTHSLRLIKRIL
ncbi:MAG: C40 family peptidase [Bacteroidales bacterium]